MPWNYRLVRHSTRDGTDQLAIHEAYYDDAGTLTAISVDPVLAASTETVAEVRDVLAMMHRALDRDVLDDTAFPNRQPLMRET